MRSMKFYVQDFCTGYVGVAQLILTSSESTVIEYLYFGVNKYCVISTLFGGKIDFLDQNIIGSQIWKSVKEKK